MSELKKENLLDNYYIKIANAYLSKYFNFVLLYFTLACLVIGAYYFLNPLYQEIKNKDQVFNKQKQEAIEDLQGYILKLSQYRKLYSEISESDLRKMRNVLAEKNDTEELYVYLTDFAKKKGITLENLSIGGGESGDNKSGSQEKKIVKTSPNPDAAAEDAKTKSSILEIPIQFSIVGLDYARIKKILKEIENDGRFFDVKNIDFSLDGETLDVQMVAYYLPV